MLDVNVLEVRPVRKHLVNQTKQQLKKRESSGHSSNDTEYFAFLNESQKHDHDFFERLAEKEVERELHYLLCCCQHKVWGLVVRADFGPYID